MHHLHRGHVGGQGAVVPSGAERQSKGRAQRVFGEGSRLRPDGLCEPRVRRAAGHGPRVPRRRLRGYCSGAPGPSSTRCFEVRAPSWPYRPCGAGRNGHHPLRAFGAPACAADPGGDKAKVQDGGHAGARGSPPCRRQPDLGRSPLRAGRGVRSLLGGRQPVVGAARSSGSRHLDGHPRRPARRPQARRGGGPLAAERPPRLRLPPRARPPARLCGRSRGRAKGHGFAAAAARPSVVQGRGPRGRGCDRQDHPHRRRLGDRCRPALRLGCRRGHPLRPQVVALRGLGGAAVAPPLPDARNLTCGAAHALGHAATQCADGGQSPILKGAEGRSEDGRHHAGLRERAQEVGWLRTLWVFVQVRSNSSGL
mmetsp:Transcript_52779/g.151199  ORF Transcript_52779/g.151199 Transcript_52779/m.151199 type:complete len:367 (+) Transcript_52779:836-1936(+)